MFEQLFSGASQHLLDHLCDLLEAVAFIVGISELAL
jgi:hypothetical protein